MDDPNPITVVGWCPGQRVCIRKGFPSVRSPTHNRRIAPDHGVAVGVALAADHDPDTQSQGFFGGINLRKPSLTVGREPVLNLASNLGFAQTGHVAIFGDRITGENGSLGSHGRRGLGAI